MFIVEDEEGFDKFLKEGTHGEIKFIVIMDKFYAVTIGELIRNERRKLRRANLVITDELLASFPPPRSKSFNYVTEEWLQNNPVIMFERPDVDDVYYRFDGRNRIIGAAKKGFRVVPAVWVPKTTWGAYIVGKKSPGHPMYTALPMSWTRSPLTNRGDPPFHYEPNFVLDDQPQEAKHDKPEVKPKPKLRPSNADFLSLLK